MLVFCLAFIPLFFIWRSALKADVSAQTQSSAVIALILGGLFAILRYSLGPLLPPTDFSEDSFWHQVVDLVAVPTALPVIVYWLIYRRSALGRDDGLDFVLIWLIPVAVGYSLQGQALSDQYSLIYLPLLWTTSGGGLAFLGSQIPAKPLWIKAGLIIAILSLPPLASLAAWCFFLYRPDIGLFLTTICHFPLFIDIALILRQRRVLRTV